MSVRPEHTRRTRRLLWTMLVCATVASTAGNIAHAWAHQATTMAGGAIAAAAIPPLALLSLTHLAGSWSRISARGAVYWCFLAAVAAIAAAAFRLSFDALRTLAVQYGYGRADAALFPLILDGLVAVCTLGLVVLSRIESASPGAAVDAADATGDAADADDARVIAAGSTDAAAVSGGAPAIESPRAIAVHRDATLTRGDAAWAPPPGDAVHHGALNGAMRQGRDADRDADRGPDAGVPQARQLVDSRRTTVGPDAVQAVLVRAASGESSRAIAATVGLSPSSVQRIVKAARDGHATRT